MNTSLPPQAARQGDEILWRHIRDLPYFRAMLRAVEDSFYQELEIPRPVLDLGCGDGHFASVAFAGRPLDVGVDPWGEPLREARTRQGVYNLLVQSDGARMPFPNGFFASVVSTSVLEHIPHIQSVLNEVARVLRPGGVFMFCSPNHRFPEYLWGTQVLRKVGLRGLAGSYSRFFNRISRHAHTDSAQVWAERLNQAGLQVERSWDYFPPQALHVLEAGHVFGLPALMSKKLTGRWILGQNRFSLAVPWRLTRWVMDQRLSPEGVETFYVVRKPQ